MTDSLQALNTLPLDLPEAASRPERKPTPVKKRGVRADIQGLRAFVVVVILDYLTGWPAGGICRSGHLLRDLRLPDHRAFWCGSTSERARSPSPASTYQPKVRLIDMTDLYCTADFCPSVVGGMPVYRDSVGHTTATYMRTLRPYLFEKFKPR